MSDCCCATKHTPRSSELKAGIARRINRAIGQLNGIRQMVEDNPAFMTELEEKVRAKMEENADLLGGSEFELDDEDDMDDEGFDIRTLGDDE